MYPIIFEFFFFGFTQGGQMFFNTQIKNKFLYIIKKFTLFEEQNVKYNKNTDL